MISAPAGMVPLAVTLRILSLSTMTTAFAIVAWPSHNLPNLIALVAASAFADNARQSARTNVPSRSMAPLPRFLECVYEQHRCHGPALMLRGPAAGPSRRRFAPPQDEAVGRLEAGVEYHPCPGATIARKTAWLWFSSRACG